MKIKPLDDRVVIAQSEAEKIVFTLRNGTEYHPKHSNLSKMQLPSFTQTTSP